MTRARIADGLTRIVLILATADLRDDVPDGWEPHEWAYVKGLASGAVIQLRDQLVADL